MSDLPKAALIIPCFNQGRFLTEALESAAAQDYEGPIDIIVIDDGSSDETSKVCESFKHLLTRYIRTENLGPSAARNLGISATSAEYILPLDADDRISPSYLRKAIQVLESSSEIAMVYCKAEFFGAQQGVWELPEYDPISFLYENCIFATAVYRKCDWEKAGKYDENLRQTSEDWDFWMRLISLGKAPYRLPETLFYYRKHAVTRSTTSRNIDGRYLVYLRNPEAYYKGYLKLMESYLSKGASEQGTKVDLPKRSNVSRLFGVIKASVRYCKNIVK